MRFILGAVFAVAAWHKFPAPQALADAIIGFQMVPESMALIVAIILIWHELVCGVFMLLGLWTRATTIVISGMLAVFQVGLISVVVRGIEVDCGCFGSFSEMEVGWFTITRNFILLTFCLLLLYFGSWKYSIDLVVKVRRRVKQGLPGWRKN
jgi:uncharacterized membrane protein YphA (DoxX/SURF4 family)